MTGLATVSGASALVVHQQKEWGEILSGWETRNRYVVQTPEGGVVLYAGEIGGGFGTTIGRAFLKNRRPFTMELRDGAGALALVVRRPWTWFFSRVEVQGPSGERLGQVRQRWAVFRRKFTVEDAHGRERLSIVGPFFRPWTFRLETEGQPQGQISKKWSGLMKEAFTDADTFGLELGQGLDAGLRPLVLAATFLIDFLYFENSD